MFKFLAVPVALTLTLLAAGCGKRAEPPARPPTVLVSAPLQMNVVDWDDYVGQFVAVDSVDVRPRVSGYLQSIGFKDGDIVRKGQVLFVIDPRPYQAALDQAKGQEAHAVAAAQNAHIEAGRGQPGGRAHRRAQPGFHPGDRAAGRPRLRPPRRPRQSGDR
jgi:multidrug efflux pump subunit AcrA (membrane-fusion protein)